MWEIESTNGYKELVVSSRMLVQLERTNNGGNIN